MDLRNKILFAAFMLVAGIQLAVPAKMVLDRETVLRRGHDYKFRSRPIDPYDPFRGKYITLDFTENSIALPNQVPDYFPGETIYVLLREGRDGLVQVSEVSREKPAPATRFVKARIGFINDKPPLKLFIEYPFNRYYMEESKAYPAEKLYRETLQDSTRLTYALVKVLDGEAVLQDVRIDDISIKELVKAAQARQPVP